MTPAPPYSAKVHKQMGIQSAEQGSIAPTGVICDWGQRIRIPAGETAPVFNCEATLNDDNDCNCDATMTCDGYCLTDEQCKSVTFGKDDCVSWSLDNIRPAPARPSVDTRQVGWRGIRRVSRQAIQYPS